MAEKLYLEIDDTLDLIVGFESVDMNDLKAQKIHEEIMKNKKQLLEQCKKK